MIRRNESFNNFALIRLSFASCAGHKDLQGQSARLDRPVRQDQLDQPDLLVVLRLRLRLLHLRLRSRRDDSH